MSATILQFPQRILLLPAPSAVSEERPQTSDTKKMDLRDQLRASLDLPDWQPQNND